MNGMLYDLTNDIGAAKGRVHRETIRLVGVIALPLILSAVLFGLRLKWPCVLAAFLTCAAAIFLMDLRLRPAISYERWLKEILNGRQHDTAGILTRIGEEDVYEDKLCFKEVLVNIYLDLAEEGERRFLLDSSKRIPAELLNQPVLVRSHENYIVSVKKWEE